MEFLISKWCLESCTQKRQEKVTVGLYKTSKDTLWCCCLAMYMLLYYSSEQPFTASQRQKIQLGFMSQKITSGKQIIPMANLIHQWQQPNDLCVKSGPNIEDCSLYRPPSGIAIAATRVSGACEEKLSNKKKWQLFSCPKCQFSNHNTQKETRGDFVTLSCLRTYWFLNACTFQLPTIFNPETPEKKPEANQPT